MKKGFDREFNSLIEARVYEELKSDLFKYRTECCHGRIMPYVNRYYCEHCVRDITGEVELFVYILRLSLVKKYTEIYGKERVVKVYQKKPYKNKNSKSGVKGSIPTDEQVQKKVPPR